MKDYFKTPAGVIKEWTEQPQINKNAIRTTQFQAIDHQLSGLRPKQFTIIAGRPGTGKTTFILNMINNIASSFQDKRECFLFISLEQTAEEITQKLISINGIVELSLFNNVQNIKTEIMDNIPEVMNKVSKIPLWIWDGASTTVEDIFEIMRDIKKANFNVRAIFVDHIQILNAKDMNRAPLYEKVSYVSRKLKEAALYFGIPVIALAQLSREAVKSKNPRDKFDGTSSDLTQLKNSGNLEQDADTVLFLKENQILPDGTPTIWIDILKNRNGARGGALLKFASSYAIIEDFDNSPKIDLIQKRG